MYQILKGVKPMRKLHKLGLIFLFFPIIICSGCVNDMLFLRRGHIGHFVYAGILMRILFLIIVGLIIYFVIKSTKSKREDTIFKDVTFKESALDILKKRYAKGEITKKEFDKMKEDLES